jgi:hypothetical protein
MYGETNLNPPENQFIALLSIGEMAENRHQPSSAINPKLLTVRKT